MDKLVIRGGNPLLGTVRISGAKNAALPCMAAALLTEDEVTLENIPQVRDIQTTRNLLAAMGAKIQGAGTSTIRVKGVSKLHGARHRIIPDRIEAGTYIIAGAMTGGDLNIAGCDPSHLGAILSKLHEVGVKTKMSADSVRVMGDNPFVAADMSTEEHPGFPTDCQAQFMALATQSEGTSIITENIFENRFMHAQELVRMGANIKIEGRRAVVRGKTPLSAAAVK